MKIKLYTIWCWFATLTLIFGLCYIFGVGARKMAAASDRKQSARAAYYRRLPDKGDKVELNDEVVTIVNHHVIRDKFTIRYIDGTLSEASEIEMLDKEILPD